MRRRERFVRLLPLPAKQAVKELRSQLDPAFVAAYRRRTGDDRPLPPGRIRARSGAAAITTWVGTGDASARQFAEGLERAGQSFAEVGAVLDFGCGAGRILSHLVPATESTAFSACDVDEAAVKWAAAHLPRVAFEVNAAMPPMPFADQTFDVVYSNSIFTHLDERVQDAWLADIHRVLRPGGVALLTTHGPYAYGEYHSGRIVTNTKDCTARLMTHGALEAEGFVHEPYVVTRLNARDFPGVDDTFGVAFHSPAYVREHWKPWFEVVEVMPRQMLDLQDLVVGRRA